MSSTSLNHLGIVGAGTMGVGIAETALLHGLSATVVDSSATMLDQAEGRIRASLAKAVERGDGTHREMACAEGRLTVSTDLDSLIGCGAVIEAISERLEAKRQLFRQLAAICPAPALLATNTSSLRVSTVAYGATDPGRIVGMHFFNPVARMALVEIVPGADSAQESVDRARELGEALGKRVIVALDGIGFLVNRCARPFAGEALRLVQERIATVEQVDRICRMGGGFRMGPFELVDLIGLDVNLEISESFWFQSYGEPRWRPSPLQARLVDAGRLGRKTGVGFYNYDDESHRPRDPEPPALGGGDGRLVAIGGGGVVAGALRDLVSRAGFGLCDWQDAAAGSAWLAVDAEPLAPSEPMEGMHPPVRTHLCASSALASIRDPKASGFHLIGPLDEVRLVEMTTLASTDPEAVTRTTAFFAALGFHVETVGDAPGLVLGRIVAQLVNEAAFAIGEGVGTPEDIDIGTTLGLNYPRGPVAWAEGAGLAHVRSILSGLHASRGEERYRLAPGLLHAESLRSRA